MLIKRVVEKLQRRILRLKTESSDRKQTDCKRKSTESYGNKNERSEQLSSLSLIVKKQGRRLGERLAIESERILL